ncbi:uncharacterized protein ASCRUDRAFT_75558 [Ascoidea rubescens DSM 1968]|uniref:Uncharacterized protein n=1 Tax=Ascoidea rubescens DSM 1968 TaxID=1344418 RepID=A0A1D2VIW6_9ASCO|nr:hypothetical protein ASCRUDRAFT_75558 [Ascoidea rubescens DSM 1968]ODV61565.1 hypothetical protein ASCRUDRAFT_75558 [Ascoidea rubescens DSM 1968]
MIDECLVWERVVFDSLKVSRKKPKVIRKWFSWSPQSFTEGKAPVKTAKLVYLK